MEDPTMEPQILSPSSSGRRRSTSFSSSPEFEFWMVRNPSFPQSNLLSADQLFAGGFLLPLHPLPHSDDLIPQPPNPETTNPNPNPNRNPDQDSPQTREPESGPELSSSSSLTTTFTASKRWTDIFKKTDRKNSEDKEKEKKKERRGAGGGNGASSAELNINIWPFSRSRSAGNGGSRPRMVTGSSSAAAARKVSSAPCSRSNSAGESKSRKWPASPARGGVHLGRSSPVWQVRRGGSGGRGSEPVVRNAEQGVKKEGSGKAPLGGGRAKVLNLNVPMCIGYRQHLSCKSDVNSGVVVTARDTGVAGENGGVGSSDGGRGGNMFNLRSLFTKKVY